MPVGAAFDYAAAISHARRTWRPNPPTLTVVDPWAGWLIGTDGNVTSQNGEDSLIAAILDKIGTKNRWCFEVGAADGFCLSNTWALRQAGWEAVLVEADPRFYAELVRRFGGTAHLFYEEIVDDSMDYLLRKVGAPADIDLGVIDVDGQDFYIWDGLQHYRPRVLMIEFNSGGDGVLGGTTTWQAGLGTVAKLGRSKGYRLLATTPHNAVFIDGGVV